jgi:AcrR family transcriptional regulator
MVGGRTPGRRSGLRERKKLAVRQALGSAALRLAVEQGLENVTVEDITAEADVSLRTFGNYFSSKYEAICAIGTEALAEAIAARTGTQVAVRQWSAADPPVPLGRCCGERSSSSRRPAPGCRPTGERGRVQGTGRTARLRPNESGCTPAVR